MKKQWPAWLGFLFTAPLALAFGFLCGECAYLACTHRAALEVMDEAMKPGAVVFSALFSLLFLLPLSKLWLKA